MIVINGSDAPCNSNSAKPLFINSKPVLWSGLPTSTCQQVHCERHFIGSVTTALAVSLKHTSKSRQTG